MVTSLLRFRSRHVCQNVLENTDPTLWKMKSLACFQNRQRTKQGTILPFIFHFPQFYSFQLLDSHHPNQMSPCPRFPYHIDHKIILFTPRKILSNLETHSQPFFFFLNIHRYGLSVNPCVLLGGLPLFTWCLPLVFLSPDLNCYEFSNSSLIISTIIQKIFHDFLLLKDKIQAPHFDSLSFTNPFLQLH